MTEDQKKKLQLAKRQQQPTSPDLRLGIFDNAEFIKLHDQLEESRQTIIELLEKDPNAETNKALEATNNHLVRLIQRFEQSNQIIEKGLTASDEKTNQLSKEIVKAISDLVSKMPQPKSLPSWLQDTKAIETLGKKSEQVAKQIEKLPDRLKLGQSPDDFLPFRRVRMEGKRLVFDDSYWSSSPGGGGGGSSSVITDIQDGGGDSIMDATNNAARVNVVAGSTSGIQYADGVARGTATGTLGMVDDGTNVQSQAGDTDGNAKVVGNVASGATDTGNPVKIAGKYNATKPTFTDGQRGDLQLSTRGSLTVSIASPDSATGISGIADNVDGVAVITSLHGLKTMSRNTVFNGTTWDRQRGDITGTYAVGNVADATTDSGNPVKVGGKFNSTLPTYTDGQRSDLNVDSRGVLRVSLFGNNTGAQVAVSSDNSDAVAASSTSNKLAILNRNTVFNGTSYDRQRGNTNGTYVIPGRPSQATGRTNIVKNIDAVTADTTIHTVTGGTTFYLTEITAFVQNGSTTTLGQWRIDDNATAKITGLVPAGIVGAVFPLVTLSRGFSSPIPFTTSVVFNEVAGDLTASVTIVGYEE